MDSRREAERIYEQTRPTEAAIRFYGLDGLQPVQRATVDEIEAHLNLVAEVAQEFGVNIDPSKMRFGATRDEVVAIAESKRKRYNRRAGVRALEQKYGHEAASRIVYRHSGRHIR